MFLKSKKIPPSISVPLKEYKRTKIIATCGPATNSYEKVYDMINAGVNGIRLNFSHGTYDERLRQIKWIRQASKELGKPVAILQDLQGPKIRLGDFENKIEIKKDQLLCFGLGVSYETSGIIPIQYDLSKKVHPGERMYLFDGKVKCLIDNVQKGIITAIAQNDGYIVKRKGINLPDTDFKGDVITSKDKKDIAFGATQDIDYIAQSFVQTADDVKNLKKALRALDSKAKIITKIETVAALDNLEEIIQESDAVMVARGDLAIEVAPEVVPIAQRQIVNLCLKYTKPVIIATQMLASMMASDEPTRAEVSDVATAVIIGADCVMLSDETAMGDFPIEAIKTMKRVVTYAEQHGLINTVFHNPNHKDDSLKTTKQEAITSAIITLAEEVRATAIVAETKSGITALKIAARRPQKPIIAITSDQRIANQLTIVYGIKSYVRPDNKLASTKLTNWLEKNKVLKKGDILVTASGLYPGVVGATDTIKVRIL